jgi:hypothetical protein
LFPTLWIPTSQALEALGSADHLLPIDGGNRIGVILAYLLAVLLLQSPLGRGALSPCRT